MSFAKPLMPLCYDSRNYCEPCQFIGIESAKETGVSANIPAASHLRWRLLRVRMSGAAFLDSKKESGESHE